MNTVKRKTLQLTCDPTNLDIIGGEDAPQIEHLQHRGSTVVSDAVSFQNVFGDQNLPGQPALPKGGIEWQAVRKMARFTAAATLVFLNAFSDGLHFSLLTVGSLGGIKTHFLNFTEIEVEH